MLTCYSAEAHHPQVEVVPVAWRSFDGSEMSFCVKKARWHRAFEAARTVPKDKRHEIVEAGDDARISLASTLEIGAQGAGAICDLLALYATEGDVIRVLINRREVCCSDFVEQQHG